MNVCFTSDKNGLKNIILSRVKGYSEVFSPPPQWVDVLIVNGGDVSVFIDRNIDTCIFDSSFSSRVLELKNVNSAISCGMQGLDSVTFSSISDTTALVCIRRRIVFADKVIDPCEFKVPFDSRIGIFHNLVTSMLGIITDIKGE